MKKINKALETARLFRSCPEEKLEDRIITVFCSNKFGLTPCLGR